MDGNARKAYSLRSPAEAIPLLARVALEMGRPYLQLLNHI